MPGVQEARTPAKNPARSRPVRGRVPVSSAAVSPAARSRVGPSTPPSSTKKPKVRGVGSLAAHHTSTVFTASQTASSLCRPLPGSGRRHTDTKGVLAFLEEGATAGTTPPRSSHDADGSLSPDGTVRRAAEVSPFTPPPPSSSVSLLAAAGTAMLEADTGSTDAGSATHSPLHTTKALLSSSWEDALAARGSGHAWPSQTKPVCAVSPSTASLLSPTRALPPHEDADAVRCSYDDEVSSVSAVDASLGASMKFVAAVGATHTAPTHTAPAPLPVTPERPVQVRYIRCAKPLLQEADESDAAVPLEEEEEEECPSGCDGKDEPASVTLGVKNVAAVGTFVQATDLSAECEGSAKRESLDGKAEEAEEEEEVAEQAPRVLDMNTTLLDDDVEDEDGDEEENGFEKEGADCLGGKAAWSFLALNVPPAPLNAEQVIAKPVELSSFTVATPNAPETKADAARPFSINAHIPFEVVALHAEEEEKGKGEQRSYTRCAPQRANTFAPMDSDMDLYSELRCGSTAPTSPNTSFADSRACSDTSSEGVLHRVDTAAPSSLPRTSTRTPDSPVAAAHAFGVNAINFESKLEKADEELSLSPLHQLDDKEDDGENDGAAAADKRVSLSSGRGQSSSYGCTEGMNSPASHHTRRSTPRMEEDGEEGRRSLSPVVVAPSHEAAPRTDPAEAMGKKGNGEGQVTVVPLENVHVRLHRCFRVPEAAEDLRSVSHAADYHARFDVSAHEERHRIWKAALASLEALIAEHQQSLLTCVMQANRAAWLPEAPLTGLHHVNKAALYRPLLPATAPSHRGTPSAQRLSSAPHARHSTLHVPQEGSGNGTPDSEMSLLFHLFVAAPSHAARALLCNTYFAQQLSRYINWVRHLEFEFLYVRIVAARAVCMLEMHERRLMCMRRDLGIRDKIELFMLVAPRPRAPTLSAGRGVISAFRMALHALSGGDKHPQPSRSSSSSRNTTKRGASTSHPLPLQKRSAAAAPTAPPSSSSPSWQRRASQDGSAMMSDVEPLFTSERCRSGKYAVPVVCELARRPSDGRSRGLSPDAAATAAADADAASRCAESNAERPATPTVREAVEESDAPREPTALHRGAPRPLNKTYSNYYKRMAEKKNEPLSVFSELHLPRLKRSGSRTSASSVARAAAAENGEAVERKTRDGGGPYVESLQALGRRLSARPSRSPKRRKDIELTGGRLRAKERVAAKPRTRTPPPPPTEADFVDLRDEEMLRRFAM